MVLGLTPNLLPDFRELIYGDRPLEAPWDASAKVSDLGFRVSGLGFRV